MMIKPIKPLIEAAAEAEVDEVVVDVKIAVAFGEIMGIIEVIFDKSSAGSELLEEVVVTVEVVLVE